MKLRLAEPKDYLELVDMYKKLIIITYDQFKIMEDIYFHGTVQSWFSDKKDIVIAEADNGEIAGFSLSYIEDLAVVEKYYHGDLMYIHKKYRKGRAAYLLYHNMLKYAEDNRLPIMAIGHIREEDDHKATQILSKFGKPRFIEYHKEFKDGRK